MKKIVPLLIVFGSIYNAKAQRLCNELPTSQQLIKNLANKPVTDVDRNLFLIGCNVNDTIRKRLLYLLDWRWTNEEIDNYVNLDIQKNENFYGIKKMARMIAKDNDSIYKVSYDSIRNILEQKLKDEMDRNHFFRVNDGLILTVANLNLKEAIPLLEHGLADPNHYNPRVVELALARLGNKALQRKIIDQCGNAKELSGELWMDYYEKKIARNLIFISTQESIYKMSEWLDTSKMVNSFIVDDGRYHKPDTKAAYIIIRDLKFIIKNKEFQKVIEKFVYNAHYFNDVSLILACKAWLIRNKGKYEINKFYCPY